MSTLLEVDNMRKTSITTNDYKEKFKEHTLKVRLRLRHTQKQHSHHGCDDDDDDDDDIAKSNITNHHHPIVVYIV